MFRQIAGLQLILLIWLAPGCQLFHRNSSPSLTPIPQGQESAQRAPQQHEQQGTGEPQEPEFESAEASHTRSAPEPIQLVSHLAEVETVQPSTKPPISAPRSSRRIQHDPATQEFIEAALRDLPEDEKQQWRDYLATVDSRMVPFEISSKNIKPSTAPDPFPGESIRRAEPISPLSDSRNLARIDVDSGTRKSPVELSPQIELVAEDAVPPDFMKQDSQNIQAVAEVTDLRPTQQVEPASESEKQSEQTSTRSWPNRFRALTDWETNPLNPSRQKDAEKASSRPEKQTLEIPKILGGGFLGKSSEEKSEPPETKAPAVALAGDEKMRIAPGAQLWEDELQKLITLMNVETSAANQQGSISNEQLKQHVAVRLLQLVNGQPQLAQTPIPGLNPSEQEFWTSLFWALSDYVDPQNSDETQRASQVLDQLRSATQHLQTNARLRLKNAVFCERIDGFGSYQPYDANEFKAGQRVLIYAEIRNFESQVTNDRMYSTRIRSVIEIEDTTSHRVDQSEFPATEDVSRTRRSDYYHAYRIDLPDHLEPGPHHLKLIIIDESTGKQASETMPFLIVK